MSWWRKLDPFNDESPLNPDVLRQSAVAAFKDPKGTMSYLEDRFKNPTWTDALGALSGASTGIRQGTIEGQADANSNERDFGAMTNEDLYRIHSETKTPEDNPFVAAQYRDFESAYDARNRPRFYAFDNSFVFPDTEPVKTNTALIPATGEPAVLGGNAPAAGTPPAAEVTAQTATPGLAPPQVTDTVASQFRIPSGKKSSRTVR